MDVHIGLATVPGIVNWQKQTKIDDSDRPDGRTASDSEPTRPLASGCPARSDAAGLRVRCIDQCHTVRRRVTASGTWGPAAGAAGPGPGCGRAGGWPGPPRLGCDQEEAMPLAISSCWDLFFVLKAAIRVMTLNYVGDIILSHDSDDP